MSVAAGPTTRRAIDRPTDVVRRTCEDLAALGVLSRSAVRWGDEHQWVLSDDARTPARRAGFGLHAVDASESEPVSTRAPKLAPLASMRLGSMTRGGSRRAAFNRAAG